MDVLNEMVKNSVRAVEEGVYGVEDIQHSPIDFRLAINTCEHAALITEVKFSSPSSSKIHSTGSPESAAIEMEKSGAAALSVLTQPYLFSGSIQNLVAIRSVVKIPILMKDIIVDRAQIDSARKAGADCILLIKSVFDRKLVKLGIDQLYEYAKSLGLQVIVEAHTEREYLDCLNSGYEIVGINNRNLSDLKIDLANTERLIRKHGKGSSLIISESGISKPDDVRYLKNVGADAFLVGTSIMEADNVGSKVSELSRAI